jgi:hypothetical protein
METLHGNASDILLHVAEGHYNRVFTDDGKMVLLAKDTQQLFLPTEEVQYYLEIIHGYEFLNED